MYSSKRKCVVLIFLLFMTIMGVLLKGQASSKTFSSFSEHVFRLVDLASPCAYRKCLTEDDQWFMERFNRSPTPFVSRKHNLSEDTFNWWKALQNDHSSSVAYRATMEGMFQIFPDSGNFMDSSPESCRTCAVVGNSGNLKGSHYGPLIDLHDVIIRMNGACTEGYEADVGTRTTHHIMYPESAVDLDNTTHLVLFPYKTMDLKWLISAFTTGSIKTTYKPVKAKIKANKDLVMVLSPAFIQYAYEIWLEKSGKYPSTGFLAVLLGVHVCDKVSVFGFGADKDGNWNHYWEELTNRRLRTGVHGGTQEYKLFQQLSELHKLRFFKGW